MHVSMTVNGTEVSEEIEGRTLLVHFLRDQLHLTGTHFGCDTSNCGACTVWLDNEPVKSCPVLAAIGFDQPDAGKLGDGIGIARRFHGSCPQCGGAERPRRRFGIDA